MSAFLLSVVVELAAVASTEAQVQIGFDDLPGMSFNTGTPVVLGAALSDQYLSSYGVVFRSEDAPYVAVVAIDRDSVPSPPNAIGAVSRDNKIDYSLPIHIEFFLPGDPTRRGMTDFVSLRADESGSGAALVMTAYDVVGTKLDSQVVSDVNGPTLEIAAAGIHSIEIRGGPGSSFDDLKFHDVTPGQALGDCNRNGVEDRTDIAAGTSVDADGNGKPDECERGPSTPDFIGFDDLPGMSFDTGTRVVANSALSDHYLRSHGVVFRSRDAPYVAVVAIDSEFAPTPPNTIGAVSRDGRIDYSLPIYMEFFLPAEPETKGVTDFISLRADGSGSGAALVLTAFDLEGKKLDSLVVPDNGGPTLSLSVPGIHSVELGGGFGSSFDNLEFNPVTGAEGPITDCNGNGIDDATDVANGTSRDVNGNGKPDECDPLPETPRVVLVQSGLRCVSLMLESAASVRGGEVGIAYDPAILRSVRVKSGVDLPLGSEVHVNASPESGCAGDAGVAAGFTVGWLNPIVPETLTSPGRHELLRICFSPTEGAPPESCSPLRFVGCLGVHAAPVRNIVTASSGNSVPLTTVDGQVCLGRERSFRRGDVNGDGAFDISDPIVVLGCLFLGSECPACADAADSNDDGAVNIADAAYLLNWRFLTGAAPPNPFVECGLDPTPDELDDCEGLPACPL